MKKLLIAACFVLGFAGIATAQEAAKKAPEQKIKIVKKHHEAKVVKMDKDAPAATSAAGPTKADGTLDKRFKANREKTIQAKKLKKDGTPDKRYNENKKG